MSLALQRAIADACLHAGAREALARDPRAFLEAHAVPAEDMDAVLALPRLFLCRLAVHRSLVRNGLSAAVLRGLPRTRRRMNALCAGRFDRDFAAFVDVRGPRTHYLRDVPAELLAWAEARWRADPTIPAYLPDFAAHELATVALGVAESPPSPAETFDVALDRPLVLAAPACVAHYASEVHELRTEDDGAPRREPAAREAFLLGYRDAAHEVHWLALTSLGAGIVSGLLAGLTLGDAVEQGCAERGRPIAGVRTDVARLLAELAGRGVFVGAGASPRG